MGELEEQMGISISIEDAADITCVKELFEKAGV